MTDMTDMTDNGKNVATLGGGCFWCIEAVFQHVRCVASVESGYMGGKHPDPSYEAVCTGMSGHAEIVRVTFDSTVISYREIRKSFLPFMIPRRSTARATTSARSIDP